MGAQIVRKRNGKKYLYYAYYNGGIRKEMYCGLAGNPKSARKAYSYEIEELTKQKQDIVKKLAELTKKMQRVDA